MSALSAQVHVEVGVGAGGQQKADDRVLTASDGAVSAGQAAQVRGADGRSGQG